VYDDPQFVDYFRSAAPEPELKMIHIGSRPSRRGAASGGVESLRAIPWQFAWTQNRLLLATWLGIEDALSEALARGLGETLRDMYARWPFFQSTLVLPRSTIGSCRPSCGRSAKNCGNGSPARSMSCSP
jgi:phosphoenolpyruvate carboxylase